MKTNTFSLLRSLKPVLALSVLVFSVLGFSSYVSAADKNPASKPVQSKVQSKNISVQAESQVHLNTASAEKITEVLKGIGPKKAEAIIEWRKQNGKFTKIEQLLEIKGIGEKTLAANKGRIKL
jgi:competence protein ComEA